MKGRACLLGLSLLLAASPLFCKTYSASGLVLRTDREHLSLDVRLSALQGRVVAITFIYTRCPLANFCFRMSNNFGVLQRRFADRMEKDLVLLGISFDPEYDQPETLADYARTWTKDSKGWHFLTVPSADVKNLCGEFGVNLWQDEGLLTHSLHTVILDRQGRIAANVEGNEYSAKQLGDLVEAVMNRAP